MTSIKSWLSIQRSELELGLYGENSPWTEQYGEYTEMIASKAWQDATDVTHWLEGVPPVPEE